MQINNKFNITDIVYLRTDSEQFERIVTGIIIQAGNQPVYQLTSGTFTSEHYEFELTENIDLVKKLK